MSEIRETSGALLGAGRRFAVVASRFNGRLVERLVEGAVDCLVRHGVDPGDLEVVRGETPHFEYICAECSRGAARVALEHRLPVGFGLLTCDTSAQAEERAGGKLGNKGWEAALAALEMADLLRQLEAATPRRAADAAPLRTTSGR